MFKSHGVADYSYLANAKTKINPKISKIRADVLKVLRSILNDGRWSVTFS